MKIPLTNNSATASSAFEHLRRSCTACTVDAAFPVGLIYASSTELRASLSPNRISAPLLYSWLPLCDPPQKMTRWTGFTLGLLAWPPIVFLVAVLLYSQAKYGDWNTEIPGLYVTAFIVGLAAWIVPAWQRRRAATLENGGPWEARMRTWHRSTMCLNCGSIVDRGSDRNPLGSHPSAES